MLADANVLVALKKGREARAIDQHQSGIRSVRARILVRNMVEVVLGSWSLNSKLCLSNQEAWITQFDSLTMIERE